jgi:peptide/nickel transport system permease protein
MADIIVTSEVEFAEDVPEVPEAAGRSKTRAFLGNRAAMIGLIGLGLIVLVVVFAGVFAPYSPNELNLVNANATPSWAHLLGTDDLGRDILSRLLYGGRAPLLIAGTVVVVGALVALPIGLASGYLGGLFDNVTMRVMDAGSAFPGLVLILAIVAVLGPGVENVIIALMIAVIPGFVRLVRGQTLAVTKETYVEASQVIGTPPRRLVRKRVFPNVRSPLIVIGALSLGRLLIAESGLSYLGLGVQPPDPSWGNMIRQAYNYSLYTNPWQLLPPIGAILLTVLAINAVGDGLRDSLGVARHTGKRVRSRRGLTTVDAGPTAALAATASDIRPPRPEPTVPATSTSLLSVRDLCVEFDTPHGAVQVLDRVSFELGRGEVVGLVGESGSGKTVTALSIMRLLASPPGRITGGSITFQDADLLSRSFKGMRVLRGSQIAMVFQDPMTSLDPAFTVGSQLVEAQRLHQHVSKKEARERAADALNRVGIPDASKRLGDYPHQFSGGMRQRVMIAIALVAEPKLLIADEPTTALDVTVQAQILDLLDNLRDELGLSVLFVTHDLGTVAEICDRVIVMYAGQVVEQGTVDDIFLRPQHPYTAGLLRATPHTSERGDELYVIPGTVPPPHLFPSGCRFAARCSYALESCRAAPIRLEIAEPGSLSRCLRTGELQLEGAE